MELAHLVESKEAGLEGMLVGLGLGLSVVGRPGEEDDPHPSTSRARRVLDPHDSLEDDRDPGLVEGLAARALGEALAGLDPAGGEVPELAGTALLDQENAPSQLDHVPQPA